MDAEGSGRFTTAPAMGGFAAVDVALRALPVRLVGVRDGVVASVVGLPIVGLLLLALILITAGCGPPN